MKNYITTNLNEKELENLAAVAAVLTATSATNKYYTIEKCWFDCGADMEWKTIIQFSADSEWGVQILDPSTQEMICTATTHKELFAAVEEIKNGEYFRD